MYVAFALMFFVNITHSQSAAFNNAIDSLFGVHYSDTSVGVSIGVIYKNPKFKGELKPGKYNVDFVQVNFQTVYIFISYLSMQADL